MARIEDQCIRCNRAEEKPHVEKYVEECKRRYEGSRGGGNSQSRKGQRDGRRD